MGRRALELALVVAFATPGAAQPPSGALLYTATHDGNADLYLSTSSASVRLTDAPRADNWAAWSPDGERIAFQSQRDGNYELYLMNADGSRPRNLSRHPQHDGLPAWSPDGSQLAFFSSRGFDHPERGPIPGHIYVIGSDGGEPRRLTGDPLSSTLGPSSWSPDGRYLLLARPPTRGTALDDAPPAVGGNASLFRLAVATGEETRLTDGEANAGGGLYSPNGQWIAHYEEGPETASVVLVDAEGGGRRVLLDGADGSWNYPYAWSPDGEWLTVTTVDAAGNYALRALATDGTIVGIQLDGSLAKVREASWRPAAISPGPAPGR